MIIPVQVIWDTAPKFVKLYLVFCIPLQHFFTVSHLANEKNVIYFLGFVEGDVT